MPRACSVHAALETAARRSIHSFLSIPMTDIETLKAELLKFRDDRNWKQFHTIKNLIISVSIEAAELLELTQWKTDQEIAALKSDAQFRAALKDECADVLLYLLQVCHEADIDLMEAAADKIKKNAVRYPIGASHGSAKKPAELKHSGKRKAAD
jgi:NTP pyrophosphatase (non-canonical NTP hydrolase)